VIEQPLVCPWCQHDRWNLNREPLSQVTTPCLVCGRQVCSWHSYPKFAGEMKGENSIGRICNLCLIEGVIAPKRKTS